jgi:hypothetical protein
MVLQGSQEVVLQMGRSEVEAGRLGEEAFASSWQGSTSTFITLEAETHQMLTYARIQLTHKRKESKDGKKRRRREDNHLTQLFSKPRTETILSSPPARPYASKDKSPRIHLPHRSYLFCSVHTHTHIYICIS